MKDILFLFALIRVHSRPNFPHGLSQISTCTGVGLYALQGLFNWGQLLMAHRTSVSARSSTYFPGSEMPSSNVSLPSGVTGTFMKKLMLLVMSRFSMPRPH